MKLGNTVFCLLLLGGLSTSCIREDLSDCFSTNTLLLSYKGDGETEIFGDKICRVEMYVFDAENRCVANGTERGIFKIADSKYSYDADLFVESNGEKIRLSDLNEKDKIRVVGIGTKILSVSVTTGQGILELRNTSVFEGSFIQVGSKIFAQITHNMKLEIPEGTYTVTVANEGYGGSTEVEIARGEVCTLDLDELKGEGPKTGSITFYIDVEGATLSIDGDTVDYSAPVVLTYGVHELHAEADGYDDFDKKLFVNSAAANIDISLTGESTASDNDVTEGTESVEETETAETETTGSKDETKSTEKDTETSDKSTDKDVTSDYLSTLSDLITSLNK